MWIASKEERARKLEQEAHQALEDGALDEAERAAQALLDLGWSGGFELKALVARARGDDEGAIRILEEGVSQAPQVWILWQLLGIVRSDQGQYESAMAAFGRALACDPCDAVSVRFNRAIAQHRAGNPGAAWDDLEPILALSKPPPFAEDALSLAAECLADLGRPEDGLALVRAAHNACDPSDPRRGRLDAELAIALDRAGEDPREAFERAADAGIATPAFLALGRRLRPTPSSAPRLHRILVNAPAPEGTDAHGMMRVFEVVADDATRALEAARVYLPLASRDAAQMEHHEELGEATGEAGVLSASGFIYYAEP